MGASERVNEIEIVEGVIVVMSEAVNEIRGGREDQRRGRNTMSNWHETTHKAKRSECKKYDSGARDRDEERNGRGGLLYNQRPFREETKII